MKQFPNGDRVTSAVLTAAKSAFVAESSTATFRCNHANVSSRR